MRLFYCDGIIAQLVTNENGHALVTYDDAYGNRNCLTDFEAGDWIEVTDKIVSDFVSPYDAVSLWFGRHVNDAIINSACRTVFKDVQKNVIGGRGKRVLVLESHFYTKLRSRSDPLANWTAEWLEKADVFEAYDEIYVPVHADAHWSLAVLDFRFRKIHHFDSLKGYHDANDVADDLRMWLQHEWVSRDRGSGGAGEEEEDLSVGWSVATRYDMGGQSNFHDCGVWTLCYLYFSLRYGLFGFAPIEEEYVLRTRMQMVQHYLFDVCVRGLRKMFDERKSRRKSKERRGS